MADETKPKKKVRKGLWITLAIIGFGIIGMASMSQDNKNANTSTTTPTTNTNVTVNTNTAPANTNTQTKAEAQKELDEFMALGKTAGLVTSYEFSDKATVVYAGSVWYTQDVQFKKDFLAKVALLKQTITGYKHFEVRDNISNEKVAEVTSFSSSLEVYK